MWIFVEDPFGGGGDGGGGIIVAILVVVGFILSAMIPFKFLPEIYDGSNGKELILYYIFCYLPPLILMIVGRPIVWAAIYGICTLALLLCAFIFSALTGTGAVGGDSMLACVVTSAIIELAPATLVWGINQFRYWAKK